MVTISQIEKKNCMLSTHAMDLRNDLNHLQEFLVDIGYFPSNIGEGNNGFLSLLLAQGNKTSVTQLLFG